MNKFLSLTLAFSLFSNIALADCDFSRGISPNADGSYTYTKECNLKVGQIVQDNKTKDQQIQDLNKAVDLKTLATQKADQRADLWMNTSLKLEDSVQKVEAYKKQNEYVAFGLGILAAFAAAELANSMRH
jgi:hypothetical protein